MTPLINHVKIKQMRYQIDHMRSCVAAVAWLSASMMDTSDHHHTGRWNHYFKTALQNYLSEKGTDYDALEHLKRQRHFKCVLNALGNAHKDVLHLCECGHHIGQLSLSHHIQGLNIRRDVQTRFKEKYQTPWSV